MKEVFISYTTSDKATADMIVDYLEKHGIDCFIAPRDIEGGANYAKRLVKALEECLLVLLVASEKTNESDHVLNEVDIMIDKKKPVLPVFIEEYELNDELRYYIGRKQRIMAVENEFSTYLPAILSAVEERLPKKEKPAPEPVAEVEEATHQHTKTVFEYIPDRGIMINPEDHQRNVSFRTDTLTNMMGGIFEKVVDITGDTEKAEEIFFSSGYVSGKNFGERINNQWEMGNTMADIRRKLNKWCQFDSAVGWGKFSVDIDYDEAADSLTGTLCINEAFLVDKGHKRKICSFIRGYCTGVMETLLGSVSVELRCKSCPLKSHFKNTCEFEIIIKED